MMLSTFISSVINAGKRALTVVCNGKDDARTPIECAPYGDDSSPIKNINVVYSRTNSANQPGVVLGVINTNQQAQPGEKRHYATDASGVIKCSVWYKGSGAIVYTGTSMELLGNANHATQWEGLKSALDTYFSDLNTQIGLGVSSAGGSYVQPVAPFNMTGAKLTNIKTQ